MFTIFFFDSRLNLICILFQFGILTTHCIRFILRYGRNMSKGVSYLGQWSKFLSPYQFVRGGHWKEKKMKYLCTMRPQLLWVSCCSLSHLKKPGTFVFFFLFRPELLFVIWPKLCAILRKQAIHFPRWISGFVPSNMWPISRWKENRCRLTSWSSAQKDICFTQKSWGYHFERISL